MKIKTSTEEETEVVGEKLAQTLHPGTVIALYGDLGAGKTAFVRGLAKGLGLDCNVSSPTFTIVNEYSGNHTMPLFHFDMYRLSSADELFEIGWEDYLARDGICAVEWSENVERAFYGTEIQVKIHKVSYTEREIEILHWEGEQHADFGL